MPSALGLLPSEVSTRPEIRAIIRGNHHSHVYISSLINSERFARYVWTPGHH